MSFFGKSFVFADVASEYYDLRVFDFGSGGKTDSSSGGNVKVIEKKIYRRPKPYFYGTSYDEVLSFPLIFGSYNEIDGMKRDRIHRWLFGQLAYAKLQIVQDDIVPFYYNCMLLNPEATYVSNLNYAYKCDVVCDAPWAWDFEKTKTETWPGNDPVDDSFTFYNNSGNNDYLYPVTVLTLNAIGEDVTITNQSDDNRAFAFTGLSNSEAVTIDNDRQIITSSTGLRRLSKFNLKWFRFIPGNNTIHVSGGVSSFAMTYQFARKIGG